MRHLFWPIGIGLALALGLASAAGTAQLTLREAPPVVVQTQPVAGQADLAAGPTEIRVTFSKPMRDGGWSWVQLSPETFPRLTGQPHFSADRRTCILPVALDPGKTYAIWLNRAPAYQNFVDADGHKAVDYLLVFATRP